MSPRSTQPLRVISPGVNQPLTEMSTRNISWGVKVSGAQGRQPYHLHVLIVLKSGSLKLLESPETFYVCNCIDFTWNKNEKTNVLPEGNCQMDSALHENKVCRVLKYKDRFKLKLILYSYTHRYIHIYFFDIYRFKATYTCYTLYSSVACRSVV